MITSNVLRIDAETAHDKPLFTTSSPGIVVNTDGVAFTYSNLKLHPRTPLPPPTSTSN
jgi:hypothetical protein